MTHIHNDNGGDTNNPPNPAPTEPADQNGPLTTPWGVGKDK